MPQDTSTSHARTHIAHKHTLVLGELIMSRHIAESITIDVRRTFRPHRLLPTAQLAKAYVAKTSCISCYWFCYISAHDQFAHYRQWPSMTSHLGINVPDYLSANTHPVIICSLLLLPQCVTIKTTFTGTCLKNMNEHFKHRVAAVQESLPLFFSGRKVLQYSKQLARQPGSLTHKKRNALQVYSNIYLFQVFIIDKIVEYFKNQTKSPLHVYQLHMKHLTVYGKALLHYLLF